MPRVIFKCPYVRSGSQYAAAHLSNYVRYMATREGARRVSPGSAQLPATANQRAMVERLLRDFPLSRGLFEYEDYLAAPTRGNASEFITRALEDNYDALAKKENYVSYIAGRPRAQRVGAHALFSASDDLLPLSRIADEVARHPGNVWLPIISLRREDASRLGYDDVENWKQLITGYAMEMAQAMKIPWEQFRWYAAFHDEAHHPHLHMVCYSADGKSGFLTRDGIAQIKSGLAKEIFRQELHELYEQQTQQREALTQDAGTVMAELIRQMRDGSLENPRIEQLMEVLAGRLRKLSGKKQYGYLKAPLKSLVDEIVDELAKDARIAAAYDLWYELREEVLRTYRDTLPERLPLSQQKEFKRIRNLVIEEAVRLGETFSVFAPSESEPTEDAVTDAEPPLVFESVTVDDLPVTRSDGRLEKRRGRWSMGREIDIEQAQTWYARALTAFRAMEAQKPDCYVEYRIGWMLLHGVGAERDETEARGWFERAAKAGNPRAQYQLAKLILADSEADARKRSLAFEWLTKAAEAGLDRAQYALGKVYRDGQWVERDALMAAAWLRKAAAQGHNFAAYALGKLLLDGGDGLPRDIPAAVEWLRCSAEAGNEHAQYRLGKLLLQGEDVPKDTEEAVRLLTASAEQGNQYAQYALGKLYLLGTEATRDRDAAIRWFTLSAAQGNEYAQYFLAHRDDVQAPSLFSCAAQLLHHMSRLFQEQTPRAHVRVVSFTDKKLRQRIREKKIALGHKADDHEEQVQQI